MTQIGVFGTPAASLAFVIAYTGILKKPSKVFLRIVYAMQAISVLLVWTDFWHHLIRSRVYMLSPQILVVNTTAFGKVLIAMNFIYGISAFGVMMMSLIFSSTRYTRKRSLVVVASMAITILYSLIKVCSNETFVSMVPISGIFALSDLGMLFGIMKYGLLRLAPVARNEVFAVVSTSVVIADAEGEIIDLNPAAVEMFKLDWGDRQWRSALRDLNNYVAENFPNWSVALQTSERRQFQFDRADKGYFLCDVYPVYSKHRRLGSISVIQDVTEQKRNTDLLKFRAERDGLTGVYNRMMFIEQVEGELAEEARSLVCLLFIDVDYFKKVNDNYGHAFGDHVLIQICEMLGKELPDTAFIGRMGGEEFAVFMHPENAKEAFEIADHLRAQIESYAFMHEADAMHVTISIGGAYGYFESFDALYHMADSNLYKAKASGRNCTIF